MRFGLALLAVSETAMLAQVEPFWTWHTPIRVDRLHPLRRRRRLQAARLVVADDERREFVFLALVSIPLWLVFEGYNLLIRNWHYVNLPENLLVRYFGYAWAFATISPGIFQTAELVAARPAPQRRRSQLRSSRRSSAMTLDHRL